MLSAMLAEEYKLIDISLISCSPGWTNKAKQKNIVSTALTLLSSGSGCRNTEYQHSRKPWPLLAAIETSKLLFLNPKPCLCEFYLS
jgi:hypothetical protein